MSTRHVDVDFADQRLKIFERIVLVMSLATVPILAIIFFFGFTNDWSVLAAIQVALLGAVLGVYFAKKVVPAGFRLALIIAIFVLAAASELYRFGFTAAPMYLLAVLPILASASFGTRKGLWSLGLVLGLLVIAGFVTISGEREPPVDISSFFFSTDEWVVRVINFAIASVIGIYVTGSLYQFHERSVQALDDQNHELAQSLSRNRQATEVAGLGYALTDERDDKFLECDDAYAAMHGTTVDRMMKMNISADIVDAMIQDSDQEEARLNKLKLEQGEAVVSEFGHVLENGQIRFIRKIFTPRYSAQGVGHFVEIVSQDVTEAYELRDQLFQSQKLEAIGNLTGGVAHDFNNLLAVILGNIELLEDEINEGRASKETSLPLIEASKGATLRGADLTKNMLSFARRARLDTGVFQLNDLVGKTKAWIGRTLPSNIQVETSLLAGLWQIHADESASESAILNLVLNAQHSMPNGGKLTIETSNVRIDEEYIGSRSEDLAPGRFVMLAISDTGHGIAQQDQERIFEPFFTTKAPGDGTGLGLSMVLGFMKQSGGTVRVYSEPGQGTTFKLYFKAASGEEIERPAPRKATESLVGGQERILVAEDEPDVLSVLVAALKQSGFQVTATTSGDEALEAFKSSPGQFDILLTDIVMPGNLLGTTLAKETRKINPNLPVIFMSGYANEATVHGNGLHPDDIRLMKPIRRSDLLKAIIKSLN